MVPIEHKKVITVILVEAALELLEKIRKGRKRKEIKAKYRSEPLGKGILDRSIHSHLIRNIPDVNKRGRPDIIHNTLLQALDSRLNKGGYLRVYIHTRNDEIIMLEPEVRIPRNYNRFLGIMEQLFETRKIPPHADHPLITISNENLEAFIAKLKATSIVLLSEKGSAMDDLALEELITENEQIVFLIGGFPHEDFSQELLKLTNLIISVYEKPLSTPAVVSIVIHTAERALKLGVRKD